MRKFALASLVAFLGVGIAVHSFIARQVRTEHQDFAEFHAVFVTDSVLEDVLSPEDLQTPASGPRYDEILAVVQERVLDERVLRIKIWRTDGTVLFSDDREVVGRNFPGTSHRLGETLEAGPRSSLSGLGGADHSRDRGIAARLFQTYVPLTPSGSSSPAAVAEILQDYQPTIDASRRFLVALDVSLVGGLIVLYTLILPIARRLGARLREYAARLSEQAENLTLHLAREQETVKRLRDLDQMKNDFIATASHELRTPLTAIIGFAATLTRPEAGADEALRTELLGRLDSQAQRLSRLIEQLLDSSLSERRLARTETFDFPELLTEIAESFVDSKPAIIRDFPQDLPLLHCDRPSVARILTNLLENAVKYSPPGESCTVGALRKGEVFRFWVADRGIGINKEEIERVFDPFWQADSSSTRTYGGVGLGLNIVQGLVKNLGGTVEIQSAPGTGSVFSVDLPQRRIEFNGSSEVPDFSEEVNLIGETRRVDSSGG